jgi:hypothetical protein
VNSASFVRGCLITRFGVMVVPCKFAMCNKNTILPSAQYKPHTLLLLLPKKISPLSLLHPHAFGFRRCHTHQIEDVDAMPTLIWFVVFFFFSSTPLQAFGRLRLRLRRRQRVVAAGEHFGLVEDPEVRVER